MSGSVYIMTNKARGVLYIGVTSHLTARVDQHRRGVGSASCRRYNLRLLAFAERHNTIDGAITREKALKAWKIELIESINPHWHYLFDLLA